MSQAIRCWAFFATYTFKPVFQFPDPVFNQTSNDFEFDETPETVRKNIRNPSKCPRPGMMGGEKILPSIQATTKVC